MKYLLIIITITLTQLTSCTRGDEAYRLLEANGYNNIRITGYRHFSCDSGDRFKTGFEAYTKEGKYIKGTVCSGFMKGQTIRFD